MLYSIVPAFAKSLNHSNRCCPEEKVSVEVDLMFKSTDSLSSTYRVQNLNKYSIVVKERYPKGKLSKPFFEAPKAAKLALLQPPLLRALLVAGAAPSWDEGVSCFDQLVWGTYRLLGGARPVTPPPTLCTITSTPLLDQ